MPDRPHDILQEKIEDRLRYYEDLGIRLFYKVRSSSRNVPAAVATNNAIVPPTIVLEEEFSLRKSASPAKPVETMAKPAPAPVHITTPDDLFAEVRKIKGDTLVKIRADIGDCTRCKLHKGRNKIVFGDGNSRARLVFVGEGPGADEDKQGIPFVGRAGKLLTQMIEAMGLQRQDVYICNVVKCRPPENRKPEDDEVATCSPYLLRQLDAIDPKVLVCLGAVAAQTLLATNRGISQFRGEWIDWHGRRLMATYHPAYLLRNPAAKGEVWKDLQKVMAELGLQLPKKAKS
ncbi:MAG TPA: uracil-DNA glycosylase [Candidatus Acidoferrum sp.]|nr:uracil-DNA glycosylase [Candidatus Acidoferrum sp.]